MNAPQRRNLLSGLERAPAPVPEPELVETAARHGFATVPAPPATAPAASGTEASPAVRRQRPPTGRNHQFNVRLRADTLQAIYDQANSRNVPIAQVIEEAMAALDRQAQTQR